MPQIKPEWQGRCERCLSSWPCHMALVREPAPGEDAAVWWQETAAWQNKTEKERESPGLWCKNNRPHAAHAGWLRQMNEREENDHKVQSHLFVLCTAIKTNVFFNTSLCSVFHSCPFKHGNKGAVIIIFFPPQNSHKLLYWVQALPLSPRWVCNSGPTAIWLFWKACSSTFYTLKTTIDRRGTTNPTLSQRSPGAPGILCVTFSERPARFPVPSVPSGYQ